MGINEYYMILRIQLVENQYAAIIISTYTPTLNAAVEIKEDFYSKLDKILSSIPKEGKIILSGNFNTRVGKDHTLWNGAIVKEGVGNINANRTLLLTKCAKHNLGITNTMFCQKKRHKVSWQHLHFMHWHLTLFNPEINKMYTKQEPSLVLM